MSFHSFYRARSASKEGTGRSLFILLRPRVMRAPKIIKLHPLRLVSPIFFPFEFNPHHSS